MKLKNRKILVTGAAGFIGSHLVDALVEENKVIGYDNLSSGKKELVEHLEDEDNFELVVEDVLNKEKLDEEMERCDMVFHLAADPDVKVGAEDTFVHLEQNIIATYNILDAMRENDIQEIVFTSSSTVYGETEVIPTPEDLGPLKPISLYGSSKLSCEALISSFCHTFDMRSASFRFANVVGPRSTHGVTYDFVEKLKDDPTELEILGAPPGTTKSYFYITDCIDGMLFGTRNAENIVEYFNLGSEDYINVKQIADIVCEEMGLKDVEYDWTAGSEGDKAGWKGDVKTMLLSLEKIKNLGWSPKHDSAESIAKTVRALLEPK
ncbi:MAG: NAD-dependent epimerase/dehydratase family protein [Candidatus Thermoplasmatota archaeon]|nr:NAD-dependent epimerase/dehydratase family protein [Candidatus Thermoplasmatota archaeon]MBS3789293.1 NAD-dependent epimerase/dehydratase family protein [Candidatus Thermoplasmatota archaeon]